METMRNKLWTLPLLLLLSGVVSRYLITFGIMRFFIIKTPGADGVIDVSLSPSYQPCSTLLNLLLLIGVGLLLRRLCDRKTILKGAIIMVAYNFLVLALEQLSQKSGGAFFSLVWYLYLPIEAFTQARPSVFLLGDGWVWPSAILSQFYPLLFLLFGRKTLLHEEAAI